MSWCTFITTVPNDSRLKYKGIINAQKNEARFCCQLNFGYLGRSGWFRDVAQIPNRWDCVNYNDRQVLWVTLKRKINQTCLSAGKIKPTGEYFTRLPAIIYIPAGHVLCTSHDSCQPHSLIPKEMFKNITV